MDLAPSLLAFTAAAALLTVTPGLDTALILRTAASEGPRRSLLAGLGICAGCMAWGVIVALGLGVLLTASELAYTLLKWAGAAYLVYLGVKLIASPRRSFDAPAAAKAEHGAAWLWRGFLTNILNPKVGVFYVSFLPQFIPVGTNVPAMTVLLTAIHGVLTLVWFATLIGATRPLARLMKRGGVVTWLDRVTGGVFLAFGARLAFAGHR